VTTILVPGAGEPNYDSGVADPYAGRRERREGEVAALLDKLQPETIVLDPDSIGKVGAARRGAGGGGGGGGGARRGPDCVLHPQQGD
jgi:hypothetical protein